MKKLTLVLSLMLALIGLKANAAMYIVGSNPFGNWNPAQGVEMTLLADGTYTADATLVSADIWFVFTEALGTWDDVNGNRYDPGTGSDKTVNAGVVFNPVKGNTNKSFKFSGTVGEKYTFTFNPTTLEAKVDGYVEPITEFTYTVAGNNTDVFGTEWDTANTDNDMTLDATDGLYKLVKEGIAIPAAYTLEYKVVQNHSWGTNWGVTPNGDNQTYYFEEAGTYNLTFIFDLENEAVSMDAVKVEDGPVVEDYYIVAGTENLFGSDWNPQDEANLMVKGEDGRYRWNKEGYEAVAGTEVQFKVVANGNWNTCWPVSDENGDNNWWYQFAEDGTYDVVITFDEETKEITMDAYKQGEEPPVEEAVYTVAGTENLFGSNWDPTDEANNLVKGEDGIYTWTKNDVTFEETTVIEFKVVENHDWDIASWPENNWWYQATPGTYNFVLTFNAETKEITFVGEKQGEEPPVEMVYTVVGPESVFGSDWTPTDTTNDMVKGEDGTYTWTKENVTLYGNFQFKVVGNHDYAVYEWPLYPDNWVANVAEEGIYTIEIIFNPEAEEADRIVCNLTKTGDVEPVEHVYTVAGTQNLFGSNWNAEDETNDMVKGEDGIYTWTKEGVEFAAEEVVEFKVVQDHAWTYAWPSSNWWYQAAEAGTYNVVITFNPAADDMNKITFNAELVPSFIRGDVDNDDVVGIADVTGLIDYILTGSAEGINLQAADCDMDQEVGIADVTALIDYILTERW